MKKIGRREIVNGALYVVELGASVCAGLFIGGVAGAIVGEATKPIIKAVIKVGSAASAVAVGYGLEACRMEFSGIINGALDGLSGKKIKKEEIEVEVTEA